MGIVFADTSRKAHVFLELRSSKPVQRVVVLVWLSGNPAVRS